MEVIAKSPSESKSLLKTLFLSLFTVSSSPTIKHAAAAAGNHVVAWTCFVVNLDVARLDDDANVVSSRFNFYHFLFLPLSAWSAVILSFVEKNTSTPTIVHHFLSVIAK